MEPIDGVRDVVAAASRAWADNDVDAFASVYADEATAILPGFHLRGREGVHAAMADAFAGPLKGTRRVHDVRSVRLLDADTAVVISRSGTVPADAAEPETWSMATWVLARRGGRWLVEAYHDCPAA